MKQFFVEVVDGYGPNRQPKTWYKICNGPGIFDRVATAVRPEIAQRICDLLNDMNGASYWRKQNDKTWQSTLDHANSLTAVARRERDEARDELAKLRAYTRDAVSQFNTDAINRAAGLITERDNLREQLRASLARETDKAEDLMNARKELNALHARTEPTLQRAMAQLLIDLTLTQVGEGRGWDNIDAAIKTIRELIK